MKKNSPGGARIDRGKGRKAKKRRTGLVIFLSVFGAIAVAIGVGALLLRLYVSPPPSDGEYGVPDSDAAPSLKPGESPAADIVPSAQYGLKYRDGVYSFLLVGQRDGNTDTLMVGLLDTKAMTLNVVSIPRDTVVDASRKMKKINAAYSVGGGGEKGMEQLKKEMATLVGFTPKNYACVSMNGFVKLVDAVGGVEFDVPMRMYYPEEGIDLRAGVQVLDGDKALQLVRYRGYGPSASKYGVDHDDYGRMQMQQRLLTALSKKVLDIRNIFKIGDFIDIASKSVLSNLDAGNMLWIGEQCLKLKEEDIHFYTLPTTSVKYAGDAGTTANYYEVVNSEKALELLNSAINPYTTPITADMVVWMTLGSR